MSEGPDSMDRKPRKELVVSLLAGLTENWGKEERTVHFRNGDETTKKLWSTFVNRGDIVEDYDSAKCIKKRKERGSPS